MFKKILTYILLAAMLAGGTVSVSAAETTAAPTATPTATASAAATSTPVATASATATATATASATPSASPEATVQPETKIEFPDVDENEINSAAIIELAKMNIINGYEDGTFKPGNAVSRAEFVKMLVVLAGWDNITYGTDVKTGFPDVDDTNHWALKYIKTVTSNKIVNGYEDGTFRPDDTVKLEEAVKMIICYLGREDEAKYKAEQSGVPLWPNGYMIVGTELSITQLVSCTQGENINRAQVAQVIYNSKDLTRKMGIGTGAYIAPVSNKTSGGGGGGGGGGTVADRGENVYGKRVSGTIVAVKQESTKTIFQIEDNITLHGTKLYESGLSTKQFVLKCESKIDGDETYVKFDAPANYINYLGYHVMVTYNYSVDTLNGFIATEISLSDDMQVYKLTSENILYDKTNRKYQETGELSIYYEDEKEKERSISIPDNLEEVDCIYNERLLKGKRAESTATPGATATPEATSTPEATVTPAATATPEATATVTPTVTPAATPTPDVKLEFADLLPDEGNVTLAYQSGKLVFVNVESYETYVVGKVVGTTPKYIEDKFRKDENGDLIKLYIDDSENSGVEVEINVENAKNDDDKQTFSAITTKSALKVAKSKDNTYLNIYVYNKSSASKTGTLKSIGDDYYEFTSPSGTQYEFTDYFNKYVKSDFSDLEVGDRITYYFDEADKKILWAEKVAKSYSLGYLTRLADPSTISDDTSWQAKILTSAGKLTDCTIKKNAKINSVKLGNYTAIYDEIKNNAAKINNGKPSYLINNAEVCQPIQYIASGSEITDIKLLEVDEKNKFTGTSLLFKMNATDYSMDDKFDIRKNSDSYTMFVPNDRYNAGQARYKVIQNTDSNLSKYFLKGLSYNIEPFYIEDANGGKERKVYVVYNENLDAKANFRSANSVISSVELKTGGEGEHTIKAYLKDSGSTTTYTTASAAVMNNAYVLDENYARKKDNENKSVVRTIEKGDVIRSGVATDGDILGIEIIYDVNSDESPVKNIKTIAYNKSGKQQKLEDLDIDSVFYYMSIGVVTQLDHDKSNCYITSYEDGKKISKKLDGLSSYSSKSILLYDLTASKPKVETAKMTDVQLGDMLIVNRGEKYAYNFIYAVRYSDKDWNLLDELEKLENGTISLSSENSVMQTFMSEASLELETENSLEQILEIEEIAETEETATDTSEEIAETATDVSEETAETSDGDEKDLPLGEETVTEPEIADDDEDLTVEPEIEYNDEDLTAETEEVISD